MLFAALAGLSLGMFRRGPDVLTSFSSLVRDNRCCNFEGTSSTLDGEDLAKILADVKVRLGDVKGDKAVDYIAIGSAQVKNGVRRL